MKKIELILFISFCIISFSCSSSKTVQTEKPLIEIRFYLIDESKDPHSFQLFNQKGEKIYLKLPPFVTENDFVAARLTEGIFRRYDILIQLNAEGEKKMEETTRRNLRKQTAVTIDGQIIAMPYIQQEIKGNTAIITGDKDENRTRAIVEKINKMLKEKMK